MLFFYFCFLPLEICFILIIALFFCKHFSSISNIFYSRFLTNSNKSLITLTCSSRLKIWKTIFKWKLKWTLSKMIWKECALWCESYFPLRFYKSHFPTLIRKTLMTNVTKNKKRMSIMKLKKSCIKSLATFQFQLALMIKHVLFFGVGPTQGWNYYKIWYDCVCENSENHFQEGIVPKNAFFVLRPGFENIFCCRVWHYRHIHQIADALHKGL